MITYGVRGRIQLYAYVQFYYCMTNPYMSLQEIKGEIITVRDVSPIWMGSESVLHLNPIGIIVDIRKIFVQRSAETRVRRKLHSRKRFLAPQGWIYEYF